ncbi:MAG: alpha/beta hydrolase [Acidimicrobiia bacterium]|nr:alpha/beta hydrolase [Acidimicrobiia bacterium]
MELPPEPPPAILDVPYNEDLRRQILDVHLPAGDGPHPTILAIHGGAFRQNSKSLYDRFAEYFVERGVAMVATNYRFSGPDTTYPAQVEDVQCALAWLHANAEDFGLDPGRVVVLGGEGSGSYLAAMLGTVNDRDLFAGDCPHALPDDDAVAGVIVITGIFDFRTIDDYPASAIRLMERFWGATHDQLSAEQLNEMSPIAWVDGSEPPFLVIHGVEDRLAPIVFSEDFHEALQAAGASTELLLIEAAAQGLELQAVDSPANVTSLTAIERFIEGLT